MKVLSDNRSRDNYNFHLICTRSKKAVLVSIRITIPLVALMVYGFSFVMESSAAPNNMLMHNHVSLNVTVEGKPIIVPSTIGITQTGIFADPSLFADHSLDEYGMEGMSPLHTHDSSGLIHVESNTVRNYILGDFLKIWKGLNIDGKNVIASVDGKPVSDFHNIQLNDRSKIVLDITS
ncbi:MAG: hypothetical protein M3P28_03640 [Thermoproteota archaeon]|nr:hypothetical protein [Thermoproteota archaeon]